MDVLDRGLEREQGGPVDDLAELALSLRRSTRRRRISCSWSALG